jgi:hypothetical protein
MVLKTTTIARSMRCVGGTSPIPVVNEIPKAGNTVGMARSARNLRQRRLRQIEKQHGRHADVEGHAVEHRASVVAERTGAPDDGAHRNDNAMTAKA